MRKIFTLLVGVMFALVAFAEPGTPEVWTSSKNTPNPVVLNSITAEFLDNTSKGSNAGVGKWSFSNSYAVGSENGMEIDFKPTAKGTLVINFTSAVNTSKTFFMLVNGDASNTIAGIDNNGNTIESGSKPVANVTSITYTLEANNVYKFYITGTKYRVGSFTFTPELTDDLRWSADAAFAVLSQPEAFEAPTLNIPEGVTVEYSSSVPEVATINAEGVVTLVGAGVTEITATGSNGQSVSYTLTVSAKADAGMKFAQDAVTVFFNGTVSNSLTKPEDVDVTYTSTDESVATVAADGTVTIVGVGVTTISASITNSELYNDETVSYTLTVNAERIPAPFEQVTLTPEVFLPNFTANITANAVLGDEVVGITNPFDAKVGTTKNLPEFCGNVVSEKYLQVRSKTIPDEENLYGTDNGGSSPLVITPTKDIIFYVFARQNCVVIEDNGNTVTVGSYANDGKALYIVDQANVTEKLPATLYTCEYVNDKVPNEYAYVVTVYNLKAGQTYTAYSYQTTYRVFNMAYSIAPEVVEAPVIECDALNGEGEIEGQGDGTPVTVAFSHADGADIYYNFTPVVAEETPDTPAEQEAEPTVMVDGKEYKLYTEPITLTQAGELSYFARKNGLDSEIKTVTVKSIASALFEINADENAPVEYFNLQGIRVANPDNGVFIRRQGNTVTKVVK